MTEPLWYCETCKAVGHAPMPGTCRVCRAQMTLAAGYALRDQLIPPEPEVLCRCEWRRTVSFWPPPIRRRWHQCTLLAGHSGPCECKCGRRLDPLLAAVVMP